jgi:uncharacterized membrane protein YphA (DoxX/SURF4 family)
MRGFALLLSRLLLGGAFLIFGWTKVSGKAAFGVNQSFAEFFPGYVARALDQGLVVSFWRPVLEFVHANAGATALVVSWAELLVGVCLVLGAFVPLAALGGFLLVVAAQLSASPFAQDAPLWVKARDLLDHASVALLLLLVATGGAGRVLGVDAFFFPRQAGPKPARDAPQ